MLDAENIFLTYTEPYLQYGEKIRMKIDHSFRVRDLCAEISEGTDFSEIERSLAAACGLLHDIGRFEQWKRYQTFRDEQSVDHGDLGAEILESSGLLRGFSASDSDAILLAAKYHNKYSLPQAMGERNTKLVKLTRDADKLDILFLLTTGEIAKKTHNSAFSESVWQSLRTDRGIRKEEIKTKADRIGIYLAFLYDLNYRRSFEILLERDSVARLIDLQLEEAENPELRRQLEAIRRHLEGYCRRRVE